MFFTNNFDYMQDYNFYNQNPNTYFNNVSGQLGVFPQMQTTNLSYFYPSIYKILMPVIVKVISSSNYQYLNEEVINNITDTVYKIVEGDILKNNDQPVNNNQPNNNFQTNTKQENTKDNELIKDIIKILVVKELQNRQIRQLNQNLYNQF
jgi:hypothetical protein